MLHGENDSFPVGIAFVVAEDFSRVSRSSPYQVRPVLRPILRGERVVK